MVLAVCNIMALNRTPRQSYKFNLKYEIKRIVKRGLGLSKVSKMFGKVF